MPSPLISNHVEQPKPLEAESNPQPSSSEEKSTANQLPTEAKPTTGTKKTLNLNDIFHQTKKGEAKEQVRRAKPVSLEHLQHAWAQFSETKKENPLEHKVLCYDYSLTETTITLSLENSLEESILNMFKEELLTFLRDKLENDLLSIGVQITKGGGDGVAYTNREKFEEMAKKNPFLLELQKKFKLDPDF